MWSRTHTDTDGVFWTAKSIRKATLVMLIAIMAILRDAPAAGDASLQPVCAAPWAQPCPTTPSYGCLRQLAQPSAPSLTRAATAREQGLRICTLKGPTPSSRCQGHRLCTSRQDSPEAGGSTGVSAPVPCSAVDPLHELTPYAAAAPRTCRGICAFLTPAPPSTNGKNKALTTPRQSHE